MLASKYVSLPNYISLLFSVIFVTILLASCSRAVSQHDIDLEDATQKAMTAIKDQGGGVVPVKDLVSTKADRLCIQRPYMTQKKFQDEAMVNAPTYRMIEDDRGHNT